MDKKDNSNRGSGMTDKEMQRRYKESQKNTPGPVDPESLPRVRINYKRLLAYAKEKGCAPADLSFEESKPFMEELVPGEFEKVKAIMEGAKKK